MQIGLCKDKRTNEVLYFEQTEGDFWIATSFDGQKKIPICEESNYQYVTYFQGKQIEKGLRRKAGWLEDLLDSRFQSDGKINFGEAARQICTLSIPSPRKSDKPQEAGQPAK